MNNRFRNINWMLRITFIVAFCSYSFWSHILEWFDVPIFYPGVALSFVGYAFVIHYFCRIIYRRFPDTLSMLVTAEIILGATISSFADELFFNPKELSWNEYVGFGIIVLIAGFNGRRRKKGMSAVQYLKHIFKSIKKNIYVRIR